MEETNTDNKEKSDNSAETDNNDSDETATENYAAYYRPTENPTNSENSNAKSTTNEVKQPEDNEDCWRLFFALKHLIEGCNRS